MVKLYLQQRSTIPYQLDSDEISWRRNLPRLATREVRAEAPADSLGWLLNILPDSSRFKKTSDEQTRKESIREPDPLGNRADEQPCLLGLEIRHRRVPYFSLKSRRAASLRAVEKLAWVEKARPGEELRTMETSPMHLKPKFEYLLSMNIWVHAIRANGGTNACSCHQNNGCNPKHTARSAQHHCTPYLKYTSTEFGHKSHVFQMAETQYPPLDAPPINSSEPWQGYSVQKDGTEKSVSSDDAELKYEYPKGLTLTLILTSVTLAYFLFFLDLAVISTATPAITSGFDSLVDVGWYGGAYSSLRRAEEVLCKLTEADNSKVSVVGYFLPFLLAGGAISAIGYGLLSTLAPTTPPAKWIGYQILYGVASGCTTAAPYFAIQNLVPAEQIPQAMAIIIFWQNIGDSTSLIAANAIFSNTLRQQLQQRVVQVGRAPDVIIAAGVRSIRDLVSGSQLTAVLAAYAKSIDSVMYLGIAVSIAVIPFAPGLGWKDIRKVKDLQAITSESPNGGEKEATGPNK
ncbi:predicted protein [Histoplasma mississippiense (nom. inval.)]|uniref:predicted protein n=1 Tax=Ajellomyces capsulatus (strain NAm1 / WU24) TaxID=2059318 RepID=UPI000157B97D|nr:predicted protein [Histoplasma mississippiense (nom. inval.)]EDN03346.1 predicted protein [Histoplasma mississippiense (nom. inval.)]